MGKGNLEGILQEIWRKIGLIMKVSIQYWGLIL
ncbi:hypothetical protein Gotur_019029 [Gossypium turneri]